MNNIKVDVDYDSVISYTGIFFLGRRLLFCHKKNMNNILLVGGDYDSVKRYTCCWEEIMIQS